MIYSIHGKIDYKNNNSVVIKTNGLSYQIFVTDFLLEKIKTEQNISLFTYLRMREETIELFGFKKKEELEYFKLLMSISGIGPKSAINVLSLVSLRDLERAILDENVTILTKVSGIGAKTAERIILELKGKIEKRAHQSPGPENDVLIIDALIGMGYSLSDSRQAIKKIPRDVLETKERIKWALKILSGR